MLGVSYFIDELIIVLLPRLQKGRDIKASDGKGQGAVLAKKGKFALYVKMRKSRQTFNKMFFHKF
jgi:hypothetical protein